MKKKAEVVTLSYEALLRGDDLSAEVEKAFGVDGLGILTVSGVPGLAETRESLLPLASEFAALPDEVKAKYEKPEMYYKLRLVARPREAAGPARLRKGLVLREPAVQQAVRRPEINRAVPGLCGTECVA